MQCVIWCSTLKMNSFLQQNVNFIVALQCRATCKFNQKNLGWRQVLFFNRSKLPLKVKAMLFHSLKTFEQPDTGSTRLGKDSQKWLWCVRACLHKQGGEWGDTTKPTDRKAEWSAPPASDWKPPAAEQYIVFFSQTNCFQTSASST